MGDIKERPILFSAPMVRAILDGRKTQTRRIVKGRALEWLRPGMFTPEYVASPGNYFCPYGFPSERLWLRETIECVGIHAYYRARALSGERTPVLRNGQLVAWKWQRLVLPSIYMPRWASRITLAVESVRIERLNDISDADAIAEGVEHATGGTVITYDGQARDLFMGLWYEINGRESWQANPWVWVVTFRRIP